LAARSSLAVVVVVVVFVVRRPLLGRTCDHALGVGRFDISNPAMTVG
jgi:hypothetical protein